MACPENESSGYDSEELDLGYGDLKFSSLRSHTKLHPPGNDAVACSSWLLLENVEWSRSI